MESLIGWTAQLISTTDARRLKMVRNILDIIGPAMAGVGLLLSTKPANADGNRNMAIAQSGGSFLEENIRGHTKSGGCLIVGQL